MVKKVNADKQNSRELLREQLSLKDPLELLNELDAKMDDMTEFDFNVEMVEDYLDVLQQKAPVMEDFDAEQSLREFRDKYSVLYEAAISGPPKQQAPKRRFRFAGIAVAACVAVSILFMPTDAYGNSFLDRIVHWGEEVLSFRRLPPGGVMTLPTDSEAEYRSIAEALEKNGISSSNCPTWIPKGFALTEIEIAENTATKNFIAVYQNAEQEIQLIIIYSANPSMIMSIEKDPAGFTYQSGSREYYLLENMSVSKAAWEYDNATYQIIGDISMNDLQLMIDSIQERR